MLYGMPRDYHRWDGSRFVLAPMPPQGLIPSVRPEASPEIQQQAAVSHSTTLGMPETGGGDRGFSAPNDGGRGMGNVSLASLAPDRGSIASGIGGSVLGAIGGPVAGMLGAMGGGMAGGWGTGKAAGSAAGGALAGLALGPIGALGGALAGGMLGSNMDPMSARDAAGMISGDFGVPSYAYEGPMTLEPAVDGSGLGGISPGTGGPMSTTVDGTVAGYGALGTPSGGDSGSSSKIVCTAMCQAYGFGSFRQKLWLAQSRDLAPEYQRGYHLIFGPLVERAYRENGPVWLRSVLEHIARHRTADIWQQKRGKRDWIGAIERAVLEPLCYAAGLVSKWRKSGGPRRFLEKCLSKLTEGRHGT